MSARPANVVICGGGVIAAATAYYLGKQGIPSLIVEADGVAAGASGTAAGLLSPPTGAQARGPLGALLRRSLALHHALAETLPAETGVDYQFATLPMLSLALTDDDERALRADLALLEQDGAAAHWLAPDELRTACAWLDQPLRGAVLRPYAVQLDPYRFVLALLRAAERMGATVRNGRVTGLERSGRCVTAVRVADQTIPAAAVVLAMGPWTAQAAAWVHAPIPVEPLKGQLLRLRLPHPLPWSGFATRSGDYLAPKADGRIVLGTTEERAGFDARPTMAARDRILRFGLARSSRLADAELVEQTACLRPLAADGLPILGALPGWNGLYVATGHGRKGILMATASGRALAELIVGGRAQCVDLTPFGPARFLSGAGAP